MIIKFVSEAHAELIDAVAYYEGELNGLGPRFWEQRCANAGCSPTWSIMILASPRIPCAGSAPSPTARCLLVTSAPPDRDPYPLQPSLA
jgi:hypothetical protein